MGLIPYPILPPSQISHTVSVDVKHHEGRRRNQGEAKISLKSECLLLALKRVTFERTNTSGMNSGYCIAEVSTVLRKSLESRASAFPICKVSGDRKCHTSASLFGTFLRTLPELVTPLKGHCQFISAQLSTDAVWGGDSSVVRASDS